MSNNLYAVLDVGSNSVRLLVASVANGRAVSLHTEKITTRLLAGMRGDVLAPESIRRTAVAISDLALRARSLGATTIEAFGTSAMRDGRNRDQLILLAREAGVTLRVLSGEQEAALAYAGAAPRGRRGVIDIGGGSTEVLAGQDARPLAARSVQVGTVRLYETMEGDVRPDAMLALARQALSPAWTTVRAIEVEDWVGVGGTITALAAMDLSLNSYDPQQVQGYPLPRATVESWFKRLCGMGLEDRKRLPGLSSERADIIPFGAAILLAFFQLSGAPRVLASDRDNLLGFIEKYLLKRVDKPSA